MPSSTWMPNTPMMGPVAGLMPAGLGCSLSGTYESSRSTKTHGSNGHDSIPNLVNSWTRAQYHRYGASIKPYAPFCSFAISLDFMFKASRSSLTGSISISLSFWGWPCRNAALISKDCNCQPCDAIVCRMTIREDLPRVGTVPWNFFQVWVQIAYHYDSGLGFALLGILTVGTSICNIKWLQVRIHLHRKIWSAGIWSRIIIDKVSVLIQLFTSACLAALNSSFSLGVSSDNRTSVLCFLALVARRIHASMGFWWLLSIFIRNW